MKRTLFLTFCMLFVALYATGQTEQLTQFNTERLQINKTGMLVLGGWAIGNIGLNAFLTRNSSGSDGHFYRMNIYWNMVNLALAVSGYRSSLLTDPSSLDLAQTVAAHHRMGKILLINTGLDVAYITGGFLMKSLSKHKERRKDLLEGYGRSLILQGGFLLVFDIVLYLALQSKNSDLTKILESVQLGANGIGIVIGF